MSRGRGGGRNGLVGFPSSRQRAPIRRHNLEGLRKVGSDTELGHRTAPVGRGARHGEKQTCKGSRAAAAVATTVARPCIMCGGVRCGAIESVARKTSALSSGSRWPWQAWAQQGRKHGLAARADVYGTCTTHVRPDSSSGSPPVRSRSASGSGSGSGTASTRRWQGSRGDCLAGPGQGIKPGRPQPNPFGDPGAVVRPGLVCSGTVKTCPRSSACLRCSAPKQSRPGGRIYTFQLPSNRRSNQLTCVPPATRTPSPCPHALSLFLASLTPPSQNFTDIGNNAPAILLLLATPSLLYPIVNVTPPQEPEEPEEQAPTGDAVLVTDADGGVGEQVVLQLILARWGRKEGGRYGTRPN